VVVGFAAWPAVGVLLFLGSSAMLKRRIP
jgi:hypothetical protein